MKPVMQSFSSKADTIDDVKIPQKSTETSQPKPYFDARRIFQSKGSKKSPLSGKPSPDNGTILYKVVTLFVFTFFILRTVPFV
jgi:hypothetical protein